MRMPKPLIRTVQSKRRLRAALAAVCVLLALAGALVAINPTGCASLGAGYLDGGCVPVRIGFGDEERPRDGDPQ